MPYSVTSPVFRRSLLQAIVVLTLVFTARAGAQTTETGGAAAKSPTLLETYEVTGSRIKRLESEGVLPVDTITGEEILARGFTDFGDFVQSLSFNTGGADTINNTNNFARGATTLNPRGLGASRFLVLVNNRRAASYPLTDGFNRSVFDFSSLPPDAIERVDYLKDGASAIYGSDAVTGVMNIRLKQHYRGLSTTLAVSNTVGRNGADALRLSGHVIAGVTGTKTSLMVSVTSSLAHDTFLNDYERSPTTDYTFLGSNKGANLNTTAHHPANITLTAAQAAAAGLTSGAGVYASTGGTLIANPTKAAFSRFTAATALPNENRTELADRSQLTPRRENWSSQVRGDHVLTPNVTLFGEVSFSRALTGQNRPPSAFSSASTILPAGGTLVIPAANPYNPFGIALNNFTWDSGFGPRRVIDIRSETEGILVGVEARLPHEWSLSSALNYTQGGATTLLRNLVKADSLQAALNGTTRQTALNPFGPSDNQALVDGLWVYARNDAYVTNWLADVSVSGRVMTLPAWFGQRPGSLSAATGGEWREDELKNRPDTTTYVGIGGGSRYVGKRTVSSQFAELGASVVPRYLELQLAGRHEYYSDFGHATRPKYGFSSQPTRWFKLRGSYSQSFKAPSLGELFNTRQSGFTASTTDPLRPRDPARSFIIITGGNPHLRPEGGRTLFGGIVLEPQTFARGFSVSVDYFDTAIRGAVLTYTNPSTLFTYFPYRVIRDNSQGTPGPVLYLEATPDNVASYLYQGYDFGASYDFPARRYGRWRLSAQATRIMSHRYNSGIMATMTEFVGRSRYPRWTGNAQLTWTQRQVSATLSTIYTGAFFNDVYTTTGWGENPIAKLNAALSYAGFKRTRVTLSCDNLLDTQPHVNGRAVQGFDISTNSGFAQGRFVTLRVRRDF